MASPDTPGKRCSCSEGRAGTPQRKSTEPSVHTVRSMMREGPMMMMAAMVVITRPKKKNKLRQLLHDNGGTKSATAKYFSTAAIPRHQGCYRTGLLHRPSIRHSSRKRLCRAYRKVHSASGLRTFENCVSLQEQDESAPEKRETMLGGSLRRMKRRR